MIEDLSTEQFVELANKLPQDLQDMLFDDSTGKDVKNLCYRNKMMEDLDFMINGVSDVYLGLLAPNDFLTR